MTAPDKMKRALNEVGALVLTYADNMEYDAFRLLLSERAELLAAVERLETALIEKADEGMLVLETLAALSPNNAHRHVKEGLAMARKARAALPTGEKK